MNVLTYSQVGLFQYFIGLADLLKRSKPRRFAIADYPTRLRQCAINVASRYRPKAFLNKKTLSVLTKMNRMQPSKAHFLALAFPVGVYLGFPRSLRRRFLEDSCFRECGTIGLLHAFFTWCLSPCIGLGQHDYMAAIRSLSLSVESLLNFL